MDEEQKPDELKPRRARRPRQDTPLTEGRTDAPPADSQEPPRRAKPRAAERAVARAACPASGHPTARKLSSLGRARVDECIKAGYTNKEIIGALRVEGHLAKDDTLSTATLKLYRRKAAPEVGLLTQECRVEGHLALSEIILNAVRIQRATAAKLLSDGEDDVLAVEDAKLVSALAGAFTQSSKLILENLAPDLPKLLAAEEAAKATGDAGAQGADTQDGAMKRLRNIVAGEIEAAMDELEAGLKKGAKSGS